VPVVYRCGHPKTTTNTLVSKTLNGPHAGRVQYACRQCHRATVARLRARQAQQRATEHDWAAALIVRVRPATAARYAEHGERSVTHRIRQHHDAQVLDVYCRGCRRPWPASGPCEAKKCAEIAKNLRRRSLTERSRDHREK
jgi:hypothetical protein